jgi:light-regulated signal transduction histidine kinase (bacteriophytochrome)
VPHLFYREPGAQMTMDDRLALFAGESRDRIAEAVDGVLAQGLPYDVEVDIVTAAGNHKWIRSIGQPVIEDGRIVGIRAACQDVTDQHRASERIQRMNEELEARVLTRTAELQAANEELEAFSYSVSHDLRAPLRTMDGFAEMLQTDYGAALPADGMRCIRVIRESAQRMGALIDDLLAFSRLGREQIRPVDVDMHALVHETLAEQRAACAERAVELEVGEIRPCRGDRALLKQVWTNLLSNAFKYTRRRHTARIVVGSMEDAAGNRIYFVRDNGTGFDMRYADKLFGVFQRLHHVKDFDGTGVGLAIVQRVVQRHGGRVWCDAEEGRGATFFFTVAAQPLAVEDGSPALPAPGAVSAA